MEPSSFNIKAFFSNYQACLVGCQPDRRIPEVTKRKDDENGVSSKTV